VSLVAPPILVPHYVKGETVVGDAQQYRARDGSAAFATPALELDSLVWPRAEPGPAFDVSVEEAIDVLDELGRRLAFDDNEHVRRALELTALVNPFERGVLEAYYRGLPLLFRRERLEFEAEQSFGASAGWRVVRDRDGGTFAVRPFPARLVHVMPGNTPAGAAISIVRAALTRGVHLLKLPSNDLFSAPAILQTLCDIDPGHPLARSFSAVYWRGGDDAVESYVYRSQFFDKIVAWGGGAAIRNVVKYLGPGLELVAFDPKTSVSMIGNEAFGGAPLDEVAARAAADVGNQQGCTNSRVHFVEGTRAQVDAYCEALSCALRVERPTVGAGIPTPPELRDELDVLRDLSGYGVWGRFDGSGLIVRSDEPLGVDLTARTVNVVPVAALEDAVRWINVATQTVGVFPPARKRELRDRVAGAGAQRLVPLGSAVLHESGNLGRPHDAMYPLHRLVRWILDEDAGGE
jgi:hypothetical protein